MKHWFPTAINIHQIYFFCKRERSWVSTRKSFCDIRMKSPTHPSPQGGGWGWGWIRCYLGRRFLMKKKWSCPIYKVGEPLKIDLIPIPKLEPGDVLVNVKACGICGSDIHIVYEGVTPTAYSPITLGHEPSGVIAALGSEVEGWKVEVG